MCIRDSYLDYVPSICQYRSGFGIVSNNWNHTSVSFVWRKFPALDALGLRHTFEYCSAKHMKKNKTWDVVISGGGTAGHLMPGISVAKALVKQGVVRGPEKVHFVGSRREIERKLVSAAGFTITRMPGEGIRRNWSLKNFGAIYGLLVAVKKAILLLLRNRPKIVVSLGGYASAPSTVAAILLRIPLILMEQNAVPGLVNRIFARFAKANVVAFEGMGLGKSVNLGNPVREEFIALTEKIDRKGARNSLGVNEEILILAFGGSLGSQQINKAVKEFVESWDSERLIVHHVIGERDFKDETLSHIHISEPTRRYPIADAGVWMKKI